MAKTAYRRAYHRVVALVSFKSEFQALASAIHNREADRGAPFEAVAAELPPLIEQMFDCYLDTSLDEWAEEIRFSTLGSATPKRLAQTLLVGCGKEDTDDNVDRMLALIENMIP